MGWAAETLVVCLSMTTAREDGKVCDWMSATFCAVRHIRRWISALALQSGVLHATRPRPTSDRSRRKENRRSGEGIACGKMGSGILA